MRTIKIDDTAKIKIEDSNYILFYKVKANSSGKKAKSEYSWRTAGYFPTLETLLNDYVANAPAHTKESIKSLKDVVSCIQSAEKRITKLIKIK